MSYTHKMLAIEMIGVVRYRNDMLERIVQLQNQGVGNMITLP